MIDIEINSERWFSLEDLLDEEWRDIKDYEGLYQVSNYGRVKSFPRKGTRKKIPIILHQRIRFKDDYVDCKLSKNGKTKRYLVHVLVAQAFVPNLENKPQVNHNDGCKTNNKSSNLYWVTNGENVKHAYDHGLKQYNENGHNGIPRSVVQFSLNGRIIREYESISHASRETGFNIGVISRIANGLIKQPKIYIWKFKEDINNELAL